MNYWPTNIRMFHLGKEWIKSTHVYIIQYARNYSSKQHRTGTLIPKAVCEYKDIRVLWNEKGTGRVVLASRSGIVIKRRHIICLLIDIAIPSNRNVIWKQAEKELKFKDLSIEIQWLWNMKSFIIPVIIGAIGIVTKGLKISVNNTRKH
jgi:hypothetical protein